MNISGLWKYEDERKKRISAEQELVVVKATATQLTHDNDELYRKVLRLENEKEKLEKSIEKNETNCSASIIFGMWFVIYR